MHEFWRGAKKENMEQEGTVILTASVLSISIFGRRLAFKNTVYPMAMQFIIAVMGIIPMDTLTI